MLQGIWGPWGYPGPTWASQNRLKSSPGASKIEPGALQDTIFPDHFCVWVFFSPVPEARGVRVGNEASWDPLGIFGPIKVCAPPLQGKLIGKAKFLVPKPNFCYTNFFGHNIRKKFLRAARAKKGYNEKLSKQKGVQ